MHQIETKLKFFGVGAFVFFVDYLYFSLLLTVFATEPYSARVIAFAISIALSFLLNKRLTFASRRSRDFPHRFLLFFYSALLSFIPNFLVFSLSKSVLSASEQAIHIAFILGVAVGAISNFLLNDTIVFPRQL